MPITQIQPNARLDRAKHKLGILAENVTRMLLAIQTEETGLGLAGGWQTDRITGSGSELTRTERDAEYAWQLSAKREELRDRCDGIIVGIESADAWVRSALAWLGFPADKLPAALCDGAARPWEGHQLVWTPHSRDLRNGWHDPTCRNGAGRLGLCPACLVRMNRWRARNGMSWASDQRLAQGA